MSAAGIRVYAFASWYPSAYKPYYDAQFAEIVEQGHELRIFACGTLGRVRSGLVQAYDLDRRTRYWLATDTRSTLRVLPRVLSRAITHPLQTLRRAATGGTGARLRARAKNAIRATTLPSATPDLCLVQSHEALILVPWLGRVYPESRVATIYYGGLPAEAGSLRDAGVRRALHTVDRVFALTEFARREAIALGAPEERTVVLPLGFPMKDFPPSTGRSYRTDGLLRLVSVGRLSEGKGHAVALRALAKLVDATPLPFRYDIVGNGPTRAALERLVRELALGEQVVFHGSLPYEQALARIGEADVLLLPSIPTPTWNETQGAVLQEALLEGTLIVASHTGGIPESVPPFLHRFLVPPGSPEALAGALSEIAVMDTAQIAQLARRGDDWVRERYDNRALVRKLVAESLAT